MILLITIHLGFCCLQYLITERLISAFDNHGPLSYIKKEGLGTRLRRYGTGVTGGDREPGCSIFHIHY